MNKLFFSQKLLNSLINDGQITLEDNIITLLTKGDLSFALQPAYRFLRTADGSKDPNDLVGEIRSEQELREMSAEAYMDSIIFRETAYEAESGFIGEKQDLMDKLSDSELLSRFLLDTLL